MPSTKVFAKAGLDNPTSAMSKHQQWLRLDVQCSALVLNFNNIFQMGIVPGWAINEFPAFANTFSLYAMLNDTKPVQ